MLISRCPQPDQDEDLPMGCEDPAGEGQRGWVGAPAAAEEEPGRLVLSTPSSILRDWEMDEVRDPPAGTGTSLCILPLICPLPTAVTAVLPGMVQGEARWATFPCAWGQSPQSPLGGKDAWGAISEALQGEEA